MVFFALTRRGLENYLQLQRLDYPLWLTADVADNSMKAHLRSLGVAASTFAYTIEPADHDSLESALDTIREHHPAQTVWVSH